MQMTKQRDKLDGEIVDREIEELCISNQQLTAKAEEFAGEVPF